MRRSSSNRSRRPGFTVSFSSITPRARPFRRMASGVAPSAAISSPMIVELGRRIAVERRPRWRPRRPSGRTVPSARTTPLVRVSAVNGTTVATAGRRRDRRCRRGRPATSAEQSPGQLDDRPTFGRLVVERGQQRRPRGPRAPCTPGSGTIREASRLPKVIVPVLSRRITSTSPDASTARPLMASTLKRATRSMPAMPMAEQEAADRRRDEAHEQRDQDHDPERRVGVQRRTVAASPWPAGRRSSGPTAGSTARSRSACAGASRPRPARSCGRGTSRPGSP